MTVTATSVKELRDKTGAGMMDCKHALTETGGDIEAAFDWLRTKGLARAASKAGRVAAEGLIGVASRGTATAVIEINSETDFVARNEQFQGLAKKIAKTALDNDGSLEAVLAAPFPGGGGSVEQEVQDAIATIGENLNLRRSARLEVPEGAVASYVHGQVAPGLGRIGVLVALKSAGDAEKVNQIGRQIAMHIAAASPLALRAEDLDQATIARERSVYTEHARASGKPEAIIEKMVEGRLRKFYEESVLLSQAFVVEPDINVEAALRKAGADAGAPIEITDFVIFRLGEGVERSESNFVAEVAAVAGKA